MRRNLLASTALTASTTLVTGVAWAAPSQAAAAAYSWTGCYVGGNIGWASTSVGQNAGVPAILGANGSSYDIGGRETGGIGGVQFGCNTQFFPSWMLGVEGDINFLKASRNAFFGGENTIRGSQTTSLRWLDTFRARFGYVWDRWFLYGTAGLAFGHVTSSVYATDPQDIFTGSFASVLAGPTEGVGIEYAFTDKLSGKLEYLHFDLGSFNYTVFHSAGNRAATWIANGNVTGDIVRVGLNYKFYP